MSIPDSVLAAGGDLLSGWMNNSAARDRQILAQDFSRQQFATRYQTTVQDLQAAGLNPMLAYLQGGGSPPSSSAASSSGTPSLGSTLNQSKLVSAQEANLHAQSIKAAAETELTNSQIRNVDADTLIKAGMPELVAAQVVQATASAAQSQAMAEKLKAEIPQIEAIIRNLEQQVEKSKSDVDLNNSLIEANKYLNSLRTAQTMLANANARRAGLQSDILVPKAKAAQSVTGTAAAHAENIGTVGRSFWDTVGGFFKKPSLIINQSKGK